jgi:hypothetical protein
MLLTLEEKKWQHNLLRLFGLDKDQSTTTLKTKEAMMPMFNPCI